MPCFSKLYLVNQCQCDVLIFLNIRNIMQSHCYIITLFTLLTQILYYCIKHSYNSVLEYNSCRYELLIPIVNILWDISPTNCFQLLAMHVFVIAKTEIVIYNPFWVLSQPSLLQTFGGNPFLVIRINFCVNKANQSQLYRNDVW